MVDFLREGGWPMFPILALSLLGLAACVRHAMVPARSMVPLAKGAVLASLCLGLFGSVLGFQVSVRAIEEANPDLRWIIAVGAREALNCLTLPLAFAVLSIGAVTFGSYRLALRRGV